MSDGNAGDHIEPSGPAAHGNQISAFFGLNVWQFRADVAGGAGMSGLSEGQKVSFDTEVDSRSGNTAVANIQAE